ncbi:MAG: 4'-phosphopantetheinyl transferase superfamily protein [Muribaculaceae bacterium]|nr:4'-phosphopantetheinyl transferase superfamily protein [Muribaculaceae bacterium]
MPFLRELTNADGTSIYVWEVTESVDDLLGLCARRGIDVSHLPATRAITRRTEQLVELLLLHIIMGRPAVLQHTLQGKPYVDESRLHWSVSHTFGIVCIATNARHAIGVDVERRGSRVLRVRDKFLNEREKLFIAPDDAEAHLIAWTAKEALYKMTTAEHASLTADLCLNPFKASAAGAIQITATACGRPCRVVTRLWYEHVLTLAYEDHSINDKTTKH